MAGLLGVSRLCRLMFFVCGLQVSTQSIQFTEPTECSSDCSFMNAQGELRQCSVQQIAISLPTSLKCSALLPSQFFTNEEKDITPRLNKNDVNGTFTQSSFNDLKIKIDIRIVEASHNRLNGVFFELYLSSDGSYDTLYCFLLDFHGTLKLNDIIPTYKTGGNLILPFYPCIDASKSVNYKVVGYPLPLSNIPMDETRDNYGHSFSWMKWQLDKCKMDSERYLENSELKIFDGRLELKINSSSLFNYNCPLAFGLRELKKDERKTVNFTDGVAVASNIERGEYKLKFFLDGMIGNEGRLSYPYDVDVTFKGNCLDFPCGTSAICQQRGSLGKKHSKETYNCSCLPDQILKGNKCYNGKPCLDNPCGNGTCTRVDTSTSVHHICTCYRGFYEAYNTCLPDPCNDNPCGRNGICKVNESDSGIHRSCDCNSGFFVTKDVTCKADPCNDNPCGRNGICKVNESDSGIHRSCDCNPGFFVTKDVTCKADPCLDNPCGNGNCTINEAVSSNYDCKCFTGFYATQGTCKTDPCFNNPCGKEKGQCRRNERDSSYDCRCFQGFRVVQDTCKIDPCYNNPCGNGSCSISADGIHHSCDCDLSFYAANNTCKKNYCYGNQCHPGNCTEEDNGYTCNCPPSHDLVDGKCLEKENIVMYVVVGLAGSLIGLLLILIFLYVKIRCPPNRRNLPHDSELNRASSFDELMLGKLIRESSTSPESSLAPSTSEHVSTQPTVTFTDARPLMPISCSKYHPEPNGVLTSTSPYNQCHETCRLPCGIHQPRFPMKCPRAGEVENYPRSEEDTCSWQSRVQYSRDISIDSQPATSNCTSVEYCTDRESSL